MIKLINGDFFNEITNIKDNSISCIITDPPYHIHKRGTAPSTTASGFLVGGKLGFKSIKPNLYCKELHRILKHDSHCYIMCNDKSLLEMMNEIVKAGFKISKLLIWKKPNCIPCQYYLSRKEYIIFCRKGKGKMINNTSTSDIIETPNFKKSKLHTCEKPIELMEILIANSTNKGDIVLDCFMGIGTTGIACKNLDRNFIGIELDKDYFEIAKRRLNE